MHTDKTLSARRRMILNLTQHNATNDQLIAGVVDVAAADKAALVAALTFNSLPSKGELEDHAKSVVAIATKYGASTAMVGGAPYFMGPLERALKDAGVKPVYAFSVRQSTEVQNPDGTTTKTMVFKHLGFVEC